jgi:hypothetical protein
MILINRYLIMICSINGKKYEDIIYYIVNKCKLNNILFNTQLKNELGGCSERNDIVCNFISEQDIPIEIKKNKSPRLDAMFFNI